MSTHLTDQSKNRDAREERGPFHSGASSWGYDLLCSWEWKLNEKGSVKQTNKESTFLFCQLWAIKRSFMSCYRPPICISYRLNMLKKMFNIGGGTEATPGWAPTGGGCKRAASPLPKILYLISGLFSLNLGLQ